ncbi:Oidioi.mRNA.OKI2018_I69.PAR.g13004.t1.cds [Oikopleura dioica]|uniref:glutathione transferase n=1 Tax=Oikopleura dioica TaxID=34765 RepID=A0ABN7S841_OIKDI|nr:Oidioi.mRNA.OKI2018_I69.PAR.g13004.t1.cds [Oikopleura dioica]
MAKIELIYFSCHGRVFVIRTLLELSGIEFEDTRLEWRSEKFASQKDEFPLGQLPVLKVDGVSFSQTKAIIAFCLKQTTFKKLKGVESLKADMVYESIEEAWMKMLKPGYVAKAAVDQDDLTEQGRVFYKAVKAGAVEAFIQIEKILKYAHVTDMVIGGKRSVADLMLLNLWIFVDDPRVNVHGYFKENCPTGVKVVERLMQDPKIEEIVAKARQVRFLPY